MSSNHKESTQVVVYFDHLTRIKVVQYTGNRARDCRMKYENR